MANIKSAEKRMRQAARRQKRNRSVRTRLRGALKAFRDLEEKERAAALPTAVSQIARARKKGVIHKKAAARYASRLAKRSAPKR